MKGIIKFFFYYFSLGVVLIGPYTLITVKDSPYSAFAVIFVTLVALILSIYFAKRKKIIVYSKRVEFFIIWLKNILLISVVCLFLILIFPKILMKNTSVINTFTDKLLFVLLFSIFTSGTGSLIGFIMLYFSDQKVQEEEWRKEREYQEELEQKERIKQQQEEEDKKLQREFYKSNLNNKVTKYDELEKLGELLEKNVITQEEFDAKKKEILGID